MTSCPNCGKPVDALRAPAARVRDGKIVPYCSKECAGALESKPTESKPAETKPAAESRPVESKPAGAKPSESKSADAKPSESKPAELKPAESKPAGAKPSESKSAGAKPTESSPAKAASGKPAKAARQSSKADKVATPATGVVVTTPSLDSGPVIEIVREPASGVVGKVPQRNGAADAVPQRIKRADSHSVQIADTGHLDDYITPDEPRGRGLLVAILLLVVVGGGVAVAYVMGLFGTKVEAPERKDTEVAQVAAVVDAAPPPLTSEQALARAREVLRTQMKTTDSPRVQRVAGSALSRTGDTDAIELLVAALDKETGDLAKVELAYVLARAGDERGLDALMAAARSGKRESKHEVGRRLALLGDKRAVNVLAPSLNYPQFRIGVAEQLAYLAEPRALAVLDKVRADTEAVPDERARATIALGHAGRADVVPALRELLADDRNNSFAAVALAGLGDESARPVLVKQLTIPSLRVQAARALRRLAPDADVSALLPPLVAALDSNKDTEQVAIAEAVLLLAGPAAWAERE